MVFFDFNIPFLEGGMEKPLSDKNSRKNARLKVVVKVMELGYTGIAYNRSIKGVMSDSDRCTISLFPLSSLLKAAPTLSTSVKFHRDLLGVPLNSPFRQYTRLTVSVDSSVQACSLNSGNPVLKTYDLVAVRPLNQNAFEQACQVSEVDLIAIDFSEKLPFRLKLPMVRAAIKRGIYFEITYSHLILDVQARRQMISNAKLLVDWTRGKNLIFSSAAPSVNGLRGPYDVANLSTLLGLSMERAKAAISKNCRSLIANSLRKKQCYKGAIRVERISSGELIDSKEPWFGGDWHSWDHISSGEGDLLLDDIEKFFSASSKVPKTLKAIDFTSITEGMPLKGMQLKDWVLGSGDKLQPPDSASNFLSTAKELEGSAATNGVSKQRNGFNLFPGADVTPSTCSPTRQQTSGCESLPKPLPPNDTPTVLNNGKEIETPITHNEKPKSSNEVDVVFVAVGTSRHDTPPQDFTSTCATDILLLDDTEILLTSAKDIEPSAPCNADLKDSSELDVVSLSKDSSCTVNCDILSPIDAVELPTSTKEIDLSTSWNEDSKWSNDLDIVSDTLDVTMKEILPKTEEQMQIDLVLTACDVSLNKDLASREKYGKHDEDDTVPLVDDIPLESYDEIQEDTVLVASDEPQEELLVEMEERNQGNCFIELSQPIQDDSKSGRGRFKRRTPHRGFPFPFKRLLRPVLFKKKSQKLRNKMNIRKDSLLSQL
ncbi:hypothetical protein HHK36_016505 [Tetracentron sinense]|uniref:Uncharacterized protein n=1 Tax=Tetracentron sinense TaxID=13715 RepID=A0A834Z0U9_TETSI|nr:hypothetical protein HHK36_016505 [Tetracentron sinense]